MAAQRVLPPQGRIGIVVSRFNETVTTRLLEGARRCLSERGIDNRHVDVAWVAGAVSTGLSYLTGKEPQIPLDGVRMGHAPMYYDASKAVRELGLPQTPVESAIEKAVRWFRQNNYVHA